MTKRKLSETELAILRIVWRQGGETTERGIADEMEMEMGWARVHIGRLGKADLIDADRSGRVKLTYKGRHELGVPEPRPALPKPKTGKTVYIGNESESATMSAIKTLWKR